MDYDAFKTAVIRGEAEAPCCGVQADVVYESIQTLRRAFVYACRKCSRLHTADSRDALQNF